MKSPRFIILFSIVSSGLFGCSNNKPNIVDTVEEFENRINQVDRIVSWEKIVNTTKYFQRVYSIWFEQYVDHNDPSKGTFPQRLEFGFNSLLDVNVFVTCGYTMSDRNYSYKTGENELAFLLDSNYLYMEHRYFGGSIPNSINYYNNDTWRYLTTEQAAGDAHEVVTAFKTILDGKWISTGASKSGMTTEMFCYYYPGDIDLYVPYVAPFCNSFADDRMIKFIYEEAGNLQYGPTRAKEIRDEVLEYQIKLLSYRDELAQTFYDTGIRAGVTYTEYATVDNIYDFSVLEFAVGFWQYYQNVDKLEKYLNLPETTASEINTKRTSMYRYFLNIISPSDMGINGAFTPYYIQAYQELGNYCHDYSYIREALTDQSLLTIRSDEDKEIAFKLTYTETQLELERKELMGPKINHMLETTDQQFVIIYGSSDPWYAVRPDDVTGRNNINIYVNDNYPHTTTISNFDKDVRNEIVSKIKSILGMK